MSKNHANRGVKRNKKPLQNIVFTVEVKPLKNPDDADKYAEYKFKDLGYLVLYWKYQRENVTYYHGFVTPEHLKDRLGEKQWSKFCQGKREFIIQRRVDSGNV